MTHELNVLALVKGAEHYIFVYDDAGHDELIETFRSQAANPQLSLTWFDAAVLTEKVREQLQPVAQKAPKHVRFT